VIGEQAASSLDPIFIPLIFGGGTCLLGLIFLTIGLLRTRMCRHWLPTTGLIVNRDGTIDGWPANYPTFTWTGPDGRVYRKTSSVRGGLYRLGKEVPVLVDPQRPDRAMMDTFVQKGVICTVIGAVALGLGLIMATFAVYFVINR